MLMFLAFAAGAIVQSYHVLHAQTAGERRETYYPGNCPDDSGWYLVESDQYHVVIGCYDPDYTPPSDPGN